MANKTDIKARLLSETSQAPFSELQRFFAQGCLLRVAPEVDLMDVGVALASDAVDDMQRWMGTGQVAVLEDEVAHEWLANDVALWTVVVKPWVVVQHRG